MAYLLSQLWHDEQGQDIAEYAVMPMIATLASREAILEVSSEDRVETIGRVVIFSITYKVQYRETHRSTGARGFTAPSQEGAVPVP